jgi:hypothetical protein
MRDRENFLIAAMLLCYILPNILHVKLHVFRRNVTIHHIRTIDFVLVVLIPPKKFVQPSCWYCCWYESLSMSRDYNSRIMLSPSFVKIVHLVDRQAVKWNGGVVSPLLSFRMESKWKHIM